MERERSIALFIAVAIWIVLFIFAFSYLKGLYSSVNEKIPVSEVYTQNFIDAMGEEIMMDKGDVVSIDMLEGDYSFKLYNLTSRSAMFVVNGFLYLDVKLYEFKKVDLNGDYAYDIMLQVTSLDDEVAQVSFTKINEPKSFEGNVDQAIDRINSSTKLQSDIMILISLVFVLVLIIYLTKAFIIPTMEEKKKMARKTEAETFEELVDLFFYTWKKGDTEKAEKIFSKAKHFYSYMSREDRENYKSQFDKMAKYIK